MTLEVIGNEYFPRNDSGFNLARARLRKLLPCAGICARASSVISWIAR